jgi:hypothetical protein
MTFNSKNLCDLMGLTEDKNHLSKTTKTLQDFQLRQFLTPNLVFIYSKLVDLTTVSSQLVPLIAMISIKNANSTPRYSVQIPQPTFVKLRQNDNLYIFDVSMRDEAGRELQFAENSGPTAIKLVIKSNKN